MIDFQKSPGMKLTLTLFLAISLGLGGCSIFKSKKKKPTIQGERISVLTFESKAEADPRIADLQVRLPAPYTNESWPQAGGTKTHAMHHLDLADTPKPIWRTKVGKGSGRLAKITATPVIADGRVYVMDSESNISALSEANGRRIWQQELKLDQEANTVGFGGGIAYENGVIYGATGYGYVVALEAETGNEIWRRDLKVPLRGAPTVSDQRVFAQAYDNQIFALSAKSGEELWNQIGIVESAAFIRAASPAVSGDVVIAAYSSGELFALKVENGRSTWGDTLTRTTQMTPLSAINDIDGHPVIDRGKVYAISHGGRIVSIDLRTGERVWEQNIAGLETPWVAGDFIFIITADDEMACLFRRDGRVRWLTPLQRFRKPEKRKKLIHWSGPVLAGDRLITVSTHGWALSISPYTGKILSKFRLSGDVFLPPVVANKTLYIVTDEGQIIAMR